jgi:polyhydroxybutyrate depolymerase
MRALVLAGIFCAACGYSKKEAAPRADTSGPPAIAALSRLANAELQLPPGSGPGQRRPLLLLLHGFGDAGTNFASSSGWADFAAREGIAWISPDGSSDRSGRRFWNAGPSCCNFDQAPIDHVGELRRAVEAALATGAIDPERVFAVGFSNGGFMAHRLACELGGLVKAVVSIAGAGPPPSQACPATAPVRVLEVHGDSDDVVSYQGGRVFRHGGYRDHLSAEQTVSDWAARLGCDPTPTPVRDFDFEARIAGDETRVARFQNCRRGAVELWTVHGGRHPIGFRGPAQQAIWTFLSER